MKNGVFSALLAILLLGFTSQAFGEITFESLLKEMVNRDKTALWPDPFYSCRQFSSYDRLSKEPGEPGWWANWDSSQFVRVETNGGREEFVMMDAEGPGAVTRVWTTWLRDFSFGTLRIYLDNNDEPVVEAPISEVIGGEHLVGKPLSQSVSPKTEPYARGHNLYLPIPYSERCKITYETNSSITLDPRGGEILYYIIDYRSYEGNADVRSFRMEDLQKYSDTIKETQNTLRRGGRNIKGQVSNLNGRILPDNSISCTIKGGKAIRKMSFNISAEDLNQALRSTILKIESDGKRRVWVPIGDFFGTGYQLNSNQTWFTRVEDDGTLSCYWVIPFREQSKVTLLNLGDQAVDIKSGKLVSSDWKWDENSLYFYGAWKQWSDKETMSNPLEWAEHGALDQNWIKIKGRGKYVGDVLTIYNRANGWWGEGDEKIYVDGEDFPSHFGTGSEDYYGYAWCRPEPFSAPFHSQPCGEGNLEKGFSVNERFRSLDSIPFKKSFQFDMELWHWEKTHIDYAPTTLWYGEDDISWDVEPMVDEARRTVTTSDDEILEGSELKVLRVDGGEVETQEYEELNLANGKQLWWQNAEPGQSLVLEFPHDRAGVYAVYAGLVMSYDYGIVDIKVNDKILQHNRDLYDSDPMATEFLLGKCRLKKGANTLEVTVKGSNPDAEKSYMFGLDYLKIVSR